MLPLLAAGATLAGSIYSANKNADAAAEANSGELPDWLKPYVLGQGGQVPSYLTENPLLNTNWMDYIQKLGQGDQSAQWNPMTADNPFFNPDQTFTPEPGGGPYGSLPPGMNAPPESPQEPQGLTAEQMVEMINQRNRENHEAISTHGFAPGWGDVFNRG